MDNFSNLIKAACGATLASSPSPSPEFERRVMVAIARTEADRLRRRASVAAIAAAACFVGLVASFPLTSIARSVGQLIENL